MTIENGIDYADPPRIETWTPALVKGRLIEAVRIAQFTAGRVGPRGYGSSMPAELVALLGAPEGDGDASWWELPSAEPDKRARRSFSIREIARMEEAIRWQTLYLVGHDGPARVLRVYLRARVFRLSFMALARKRGWTRGTADWGLERALGLIAQGLGRDGVPLS